MKAWTLGLRDWVVHTAVALCMCVAGTAWAQNPAAPAAAGAPAALPAAELFFKAEEILSAKLSPSGRYLAATTAAGGDRVGLFIWKLAEAGPRALGAVSAMARFTDIDVHQFFWVNDEQLVFNLIDRSEGWGSQRPTGLYALRIDGQGLRELVSRLGPGPAVVLRRSQIGQVQGRVALGANHTLLAVPAVGDEVIVGELKGAGGDLVEVRPLWLSLASSRTRDASAGGPAGATRWWFDRRGEARLALVRRDTRRQLHWRAPGQTAWRQIDDSEITAVPYLPAFVTDDGTLYVTRSEGREGLRVLTTLDTTTGKLAPQPLLRVPGFDYGGTPVWGEAGAGSGLLGVHLDAETPTSVWLDERMKRWQQLADERLPGHVNRITCRRCGQGDAVLLVHAANDRDAGHWWIYREAAARAASGDAVNATRPGWQLLSLQRPGLEPKRMASVAFTRIRARDGRELPLWLTLPAGFERRAGAPSTPPRAAVVLVHGGPWLRGGYWEWSAMEQFLASRGYVVISPEFRGSAGYGFAHQVAGYRQWGQAMQDDVADATRWAREQGLADRFCIAGASFGGYSALMGLVRHGELYRCGVAWAAASDLFLLLRGSWWVDDDMASIDRRVFLPRRVGDAERDAEMLKANSPLEQAARIRAPLLLAHGARDRRVPIEHSHRLREAMRAAGNEPQWVSYGDEAHGWLKLETHVDFARRLEAFLEQHLKPAR